ncbi:DUF5343 domain-containing protein [Algoriphagus namhaensis]
MALSTHYLVKSGDLKKFLDTIKNAQAPDKFTHKFVQDLGFKSTNDRLYIGLLKSLGFLDQNSVPTTRYYNFLDPGQSNQMMIDGIMDAYEDLFAINTKANELSFSDVKGKMKSLTQGSKSDSIYSNMARTFKALTDIVEWKDKVSSTKKNKPTEVEVEEKTESSTQKQQTHHEPETIIKRNRTELHYNIQIHLPATRDTSVYDAIFQSLKKHLLDD